VVGEPAGILIFL